MAQLVECVPNFSEGRRPEVLDEIIREITSVDGITLLDHEMDASHNRAVVTFVGPPMEAKRRSPAARRDDLLANQHRRRQRLARSDAQGRARSLGHRLRLRG